jgi:hypothetical protein
MKVGIDLQYCNHTHFQTRGRKGGTIYVSVICTWRVYFSSDFDGFFLINSLGK